MEAGKPSSLLLFFTSWAQVRSQCFLAKVVSKYLLKAGQVTIQNMEVARLGVRGLSLGWV
jgi:hypothetical protein